MRIYYLTVALSVTIILLPILYIMNVEESVIHAQSSNVDPFSQVLHLLKFDVSIYHNAKVCGNWRITEHSLGATCFHIALTGSMILDVPGHFNGAINSGDLIIFPRELPHSMVSAVPLQGVQRHLPYTEAVEIDGTGLLCGSVRFQHPGGRYMLDALPAVLIISYKDSNYWLKSLQEIFIAENLRINPASKLIFDKLSELLFTFALRQYLLDRPAEAGMFALYGHPRLSKVVEAIHRHPEHRWTLAEMAKEAALSRTVFCEVFKSVSGWSAGEYLIWWRMQLAWSLLSNGEHIADVACKIGYQSESAFSRTFRKIFNTVAGDVRRNHAKFEAMANKRQH